MKYTTDADGNQNKCEEVCEPWNALCTAKLKEVMQAGRDAFAWQTREDTLAKQKGANFDQWLKPRQIALRPLRVLLAWSLRKIESDLTVLSTFETVSGRFSSCLQSV